MDARIVRSQNAIKDSMAILIQKKPVNKISVVEICKAANVNRATFYKYFESPMDLLGKMEEDLLDGLAKKIENENPTTPEEFVKLVMDELDSHRNIYSLVFFGDGDYLFRKKFIDVIQEHSLVHIKRFFPLLSDFYVNLVFHYLISGCLGVVQIKYAGAYPEHTVEEIRKFSHSFTNFLCGEGLEYAVEGVNKDVWTE